MKGIQKIEADREARRAKMQQMKEAKEERKLANQAAGKVNDVEYDLLIEQNKANVGAALNHVSATEMNICICVRKRPLFDKEYQAGEIDAVSTSNPNVVVHEPKIKVDGITKYVQDTSFQFDNTFNENENSQDMYQFSIRDLLPSIFENGIVTCFAYGQTGSGKTFTVNAITKYAINDIFKHA
jgi:kinesin family member 2/24